MSKKQPAAKATKTAQQAREAEGSDVAATDTGDGAGATSDNLMAPVFARIEELAARRDQAAEEHDQALRKVQDLWATPGTAQQFADLVVRHTVDKLAAAFYAKAGIASVLGAMMNPSGYRPLQPVDGRAAMKSPDQVAQMFRGPMNERNAGQTGMPLGVADMLALQRAQLGDFERMADVPVGALLGVCTDAVKPQDQRLIFAGALAVFGGDRVRRQVHDWALAYYRQNNDQGGDSAGEAGAEWDIGKVCADIEAAQAVVSQLQNELQAIDDELVQLPVVHFDDNGEMACAPQRAARHAKNLPPVFGPRKVG